MIQKRLRIGSRLCWDEILRRIPIVLTPSSTLTAALLRKIETRTARIGIIGMGYVGLPLTLLFSEQRFQVTGFDIDSHKVKTLNEGGSYIVRIPGTDIQAAQKAGFSATADYSKLRQMDAVVICVPTPLDEYPDRAGEHHLSRNDGRGGYPAA